MYLKNTEFICKRIITLPFNEFSRKRFNYVLKNLSKVISTNKGIFLKKKINILFVHPIKEFSGSLKSLEEYLKLLKKNITYFS